MCCNDNFGFVGNPLSAAYAWYLQKACVVKGQGDSRVMVYNAALQYTDTNNTSQLTWSILSR